MELKHEIRVGIPIEKAWETFTDIEFIAPCMPGAKLTEVEGDEYKGQVSIKVGPITAQYKGVAKFISQDKDSHTVVVSASGRDSRGAGNAAAEITAQLRPDGDGTAIDITTDLKVSGKVAQLGRGMMSSVSEKLLGQFAESLEAKLEETGGGNSGSDAASPNAANTASGNPSPTNPDSTSHNSTGSADNGGARKIDMPEPEPVDLLAQTDTTLARRIAPIAIGLFVLWLLRRRRRRRRRMRQA